MKFEERLCVALTRHKKKKIASGVGHVVCVQVPGLSAGQDRRCRAPLFGFFFCLSFVFFWLFQPVRRFQYIADKFAHNDDPS